MSKKLVLVVEDHKDQNEWICELVRKSGYEPIQAFNGMEAFAQLRKYQRGLGFLTNKISCILLDWNMPKMRGEEFLKILRRQEKSKTFCAYIPVVIITVLDDKEKRTLAANSYFGRVASYLPKPFNPDELMDTLHRIIRDKDNETLVEINREKTFRDPNEFERLFQEKIMHEEQIKEAFCKGETNTLSLEYLDKKRLEMEITFEECSESGGVDKGTMENLKKIKKIINEEYYKMLNKVEPKDKPDNH